MRYTYSAGWENDSTYNLRRKKIMALDLKKMKQKQVALQGNGNGKRWFWKPQDGEQTVRIVPDSGFPGI